MAGRRTLTRAERALVYGLLGWAVEVGFTGAGAALSDRRTWRLEGHSYLWMLPIYGLVAVLFEPVHERLRHAPRRRRALAYAAGFIAVEYASGTLLRKAVGVVPWDYTGRSRFALPGGAVRLDYTPLWAAAGLALEPVHDALVEAPLLRTRGRAS